MIKLYDSYSKLYKNLDTSKPINIYNCGPTVYNHIHIGNARPLIIFDVLYRFLKYQNFSVNYVLNITDIDDKIINKAINENKSETEISEYFTAQYLAVQKQLNTLPMTIYKVSDHINDIIEYINTLIDKGYAYKSNNDVYFDTSKISSYGTLSNNQIEDLNSGVRIDINSNKKNPNDFVLWKETKIGLKWDSIFGSGRPGWHTECSCLINKYLSDTIDIHGGGMDLKFPHHENENAQNLALTNKNLANIWMHIGMINIDNKKMSKSLNNFILVKDILLKYPYQALRWFFYQTNYANPLNFSDNNITNAMNEINKFNLIINKVKSFCILNNIDYAYDINKIKLSNEFIEHLNNNLNLSNCVTHLHLLLKKINNIINDYKNINFDILLPLFKQLIKELDILGISFNNIHTKENIELLKSYQNELNNKNYEKSDFIRQKLISLGLI